MDRFEGNYVKVIVFPQEVQENLLLFYDLSGYYLVNFIIANRTKSIVGLVQLKTEKCGKVI